MLLHLTFRKTFPFLRPFLIIECIPDRMCQSPLPALFPEKLRHLLQFRHSPAERFTVLQITVAHNKMHMDMLCVRMHRPHCFISLAPKKFMRKFPCYLICFLIGQLIIIIRMKGNRHLMCQNIFLFVTRIFFIVHLPCYKQTVSKIIPVTPKRSVQIRSCLLDPFFNLFFFRSKNIICRTF